MANRKGNTLVIVAVVVVLGVLVLGYLMRHQIKALLGMNPANPAATTQTTTNNPAVPTNNIYTTKTDPTKGNYMADFNGMTLYTSDKDTNGVSNCAGACLKAWPSYTSGATAQGTFPTDITVITRSDGGKQFTWKGMPLYYFQGDTKAGDITGDGVNGFHIVKL